MNPIVPWTNRVYHHLTGNQTNIYHPVEGSSVGEEFEQMAWGPGFRVKSKANNAWEDMSKASSCRRNELSGHLLPLQGFPGGSVSKKSICNAGDHLWCKRSEFDPWVWKIPWRKKWQLTSVFLPGESRGQRSLAYYCPWGCRMSQTRLND